MAKIDPTLAGKPLSISEKVAWGMLPFTGFVLVILFWLTRQLPFTHEIAWFSGLAINFNIYIDGLSLLMLALITGVGSAVYLYAASYFYNHPQLRRLYILLTIFMLAMIGCVISDHLIMLFIFWELTSVTSFLLVLFNYQTEESRNSGKQALLITGAGGLCLLAGFMWIWQLTGTAQLSLLMPQLGNLITHPQFKWAMLLVLLGAFTKSAQFPFQFWLPNAMAAPTPVSAYLHSATMVKLGIFLLLRFDYALTEWHLWQQTLQIIGSITAAWGMLLSLRERDLKKILAWSTVASLGTMVTLIGLNSHYASIATVTFILAHALYKAPLFFVAGNIDYATGTRILDNLGGLKRHMPWTSVVAMLAALSMAGMPTSFGYVAKDALNLAKKAGEVIPFSVYANFVFSIIAVAVAAVAAIRVFWMHPGRNITPNAKEAPLKMRIAPALIAGIGLTIGLFPQFATPLISGASQAITAEQIGIVDLHIGWREIKNNSITLFSALIFGLLVFYFWDQLHRTFDRLLSKFPRWGGEAVYHSIIDAIPELTAKVTGRLQHGKLSGYILWVILFSTFALGASLMWGVTHWRDFSVNIHDLINPLPSLGLITACVMIIISAMLVMFSRKPFLLLLNSGLIGFGSALLFIFVSAPDVAFTQFIVETILVIILSAVMIMLSRNNAANFSRQQDRSQHPKWLAFTLLLSVLFASFIVLTLVLILGLEFDTMISDYYIEHSYVTAFGRNIINVILVDFRALDTFGEVAVMFFSLLAARPLLQELKKRNLKRKKRLLSGGKQ